MSPLTKRNLKQHWPVRQQGAVIVLVVIALVAIMLMGALALDGGHMLLNKTRLQNAVDAAALSGAKTLQQSFGSGNASTLARDAALDTLARNAAAEGNGELGQAIGATAPAVAGYTVVTLSNSVYGPFSFPGPADARYVRVSVPNYPLTGFLWGVAQVFGGVGDKVVAAIATAGPSPSASPCKIEPIMVCGDPGEDPAENGGASYWGYEYGELEVLKSAAGNEPAIGPGNFQLLRLDGSSGANDLRTALAGGIEKCNVVGDEVGTEPGNTVGPVAQGLNTRFGVYNGPGMNATDYPPDWVTEFNDPKMTYNDSTSPAQVEYQGQPVTSSGGDLSAGGTPLYDLNDWKTDSAACAASGSCAGAYERRMLNIVIGNCDGASGGQVDVPVLDFGCFFMLQTVAQQGVSAQVFGQFVKECEGDGVAGPVPTEDTGPAIIQLYKTYVDDSSTPSTDS
ncbi:Putative Flp pilus-assembly TadE/G-like [Geopseudomonas sagittaria]|uniref:Flp pilus-assembly TadE/G-like n=1 Tax=Geopseudomonas sagittaria TaxID=1135990 RepID=A0A1I5PBX8_9GAMM|nr:pilus assembly protein TadG-related protein [Pseudomonas sagittaria]SFP31021.1 Putative Flp pilus-assembly TadE/G-like [Pseudomonas sagittaria]